MPSCGSGDRPWLMLNNVVPGDFLSHPSSPSSTYSSWQTFWSLIQCLVVSHCIHSSWVQLQPPLLYQRLWEECVVLWSLWTQHTGQWPVMSCLWTTLSERIAICSMLDIVPGLIGSGDPAWTFALCGFFIIVLYGTYESMQELSRGFQFFSFWYVDFDWASCRICACPHSGIL